MTLPYSKQKWNVAGPLGIDENMNRIVGRGVLKENTGEGCDCCAHWAL